MWYYESPAPKLTLNSSTDVAPIVQLEGLQGLQKSIRLALLRQAALPRRELPRLRGAMEKPWRMHGMDGVWWMII